MSKHTTINMKEHLEITQNISGRATENSSVVQRLNQKINELLKYQEQVVDMETKLKMLQESYKLLESESVFQNKELNNQIKILEKENEELKNYLTKNNFKNIGQQIDVKVNIQEEKIKILESELLSYKKKIQNLEESFNNNEKAYKEKINRLRQRLNNVGDEDGVYSRDLNMASEFNKEKEMNELNKNSSQLAQKNTFLNIQLNNADEKISRQNREIEELREEIKLLNDTNDKIKKYNDQLREENEKLNMKVTKYKVANENSSAYQEKLESAVKSQKELRERVEELQRLFNFPVDPEDESIQWEKMKSAIIESREQSNVIANLEKKIQNYKQSLEVAVKEVQHAQESRNVNTSSFVEETGPLLSQLQSNLRSEHQKNVDLTKQITLYKIKSQMGRALDVIQARAIDRISDLHSVICDNSKTLMRQLILAVIFTNRFLVNIKKSKHIDFSSLSIFNSCPENRIDVKIKEMKIRFTQLTDELVQTRSALTSEHDSRRRLKMKLNNTDEPGTLETKYKTKIALLKHKIHELESRLATSVSPEMFERIKDQLDHEMYQSMELQKTNDQLKSIILDKERENEQIIDRTNHLKSKLNHANQEINVLKDKVEDQNDELETYSKLMGTKNKEILSLERLKQKKEVISLEPSKPVICAQSPTKQTPASNQNTHSINPFFL